MADPLSGHASSERRIGEILDRSKRQRGLFWDLGKIRDAAIILAIRRASISPMVNSREFKAANDRASARLLAQHRPLIRKAARRALKEADTKLSRRAFQEFTESVSRETSDTFLGQLDRASRRNLTRLIANAGRRFRNDSSILDELVRSIRPQLGLTSKVAASMAWQIKKVSESAKLGARQVIALARERQGKAFKNRAVAAARRQVVIAVNTARRKAWEIAAAVTGRELEKHWRDQEDDRVRDLHRQQTGEGWISFKELYSVFRVLHPPAPEMGCRCYEEVRWKRAR